jgi:DNA-binding beta-propeller fold protein YncE
MMRGESILGVVAVLMLGGAAPTSPPTPGYHLLRRLVLGGDAKWDYLTIDPDRRRLFVTHGTEVLVVDADADTVVGRIPDTPGIHGVALAPAVGRGFTSNGRDSTVTVFDLASLQVLDRLTATGRKPDAIVYDSVTGRVFTFNGGSGNATAFEAATGKILGTIPLGGSPEFAVADGKGRLYVNLEDKSEVVQIDAQKLTAGAHWPLAPCESPSGMAIDRVHRRLFVGCANRLMAVVDADGGRVLATLPIGGRVDANAFDPGTGLAFSSNGEGTLTVVQAGATDPPRVLENVTTEPGARTMAVDPRSHRVYLVTAKFNPPPPGATKPTGVDGTFALLVFGQ